MNTAPPLTNRTERTQTKMHPAKRVFRKRPVGSGKEHDANNFANDRERAAAAGRKGGHESHKRD